MFLVGDTTCLGIVGLSPGERRFCCSFIMLVTIFVFPLAYPMAAFWDLKIYWSILGDLFLFPLFDRTPEDSPSAGLELLTLMDLL